MTTTHSRRSFLRASATLPLLGLGGGIFTSRARAASPVAALSPANDRIQKAREVALSVLKPSPRDLDYGFKLHAESLVFESYGFAPRAALDGAKFTEFAAGGATEPELADLREEMSMTRWATDTAERKEFLEAFRAAGVTCVFQNTGEEGSDPLRLVKRLARFTYATDLAREDCFKATRPDDIVAAKKAGRQCLYFTTNGVPLRQQWESVRDELRLIRIF
ncbi:MAG: dipeptidase, partial [Verrucomicrobia bacterium]|nr:dipeptidase [Verrucomicrobiota bacterium]NDE99078.1 dipeptidase [Verrucomicrobiota bacterium]